MCALSLPVAIEILKFSTRAIMGVPTLLVFPLVWLTAVVAYVVCWLIGFLILDQVRCVHEDRVCVCVCVRVCESRGFEKAPFYAYST